ncbi:MAG: metallophosphoesterase family protein [Lentisphaeria bacterium]|nr:metallophosphoesterase family protein [Lentisphaeria bacterium]
MAKYAILSDIHANLEALEVVLEKCKHLDPQMKFVCLGDIVGYNANPRECLAIVRSLGCERTVLGNHDQYVSFDDPEMEGFNVNAKAAVLWTREQLTEEERAYLGQARLREGVPGTNMTLVHATLDSPDQWGYIFDQHHAQSSFSYQFSQLCFCGHSHVPVAFRKKPFSFGDDRTYEEIREWAPEIDAEGNPEVFLHESCISVKLEAGHKYLFNIGSIGQPRNHDPRASFAVYDSSAMTVSRYCLPYDVETTQAKIRAAGLPERLANRLVFGI